jgi:hypothetical protein
VDGTAFGSITGVRAWPSARTARNEIERNDCNFAENLSTDRRERIAGQPARAVTGSGPCGAEGRAESVVAAYGQTDLLGCVLAVDEATRLRLARAGPDPVGLMGCEAKLGGTPHEGRMGDA